MARIRPTYPHSVKTARRSQLSVQPGFKTPVKEITVPKTVNDSAMMAMSSAKKKSSKQADKNKKIPNNQNNSERVARSLSVKPAVKVAERKNPIKFSITITIIMNI